MDQEPFVIALTSPELYKMYMEATDNKPLNAAREMLNMLGQAGLTEAQRAMIDAVQACIREASLQDH
jgi:hypothetical protein